MRLKRIFCVAFALLLLVNSTFSCAVFAGDLPVEPTPTPFGGMPWWDDDDWTAYNQFQKFNDNDDLLHKFNNFLLRAVTGSDVVSKEFGKTAADALFALIHDLANAGDLRTDGDNIYVSQNAVEQVNDLLQDKIHALDGYYLIIPANTSCDIEKLTGSYTYADDVKQEFLSFVNDNPTFYIESYQSNIVSFGESKFYYYFNEDHKGYLDAYNIDTGKYEFLSCSAGLFFYKGYINSRYPSASGGGVMWPFAHIVNTESGLERLINNSYGQAYKVFYSRQDVENYMAKGRRYVSRLPMQIIRVPVSVVNNTPEINYNITTENKTETEIQNEYNQQLNNYINNLYPSAGSPTPTPTPAWGDGSATPTPTPAWGDGSVTPTPSPGSGVDMTETNDMLHKIYDLLQKFFDSYIEFTKKVSDRFEDNDAFFKKVSEYLEGNNKKLDEIVDAIDKLSQGKEEGEEKGCKYDYKELSDFMTKLWNDSDQKFDTMIELLEENNEYQEKLVNTLNSIKNILKAQTVMDSFKNRSKETANKAKEKFPTSVPWDVAMIVNAMSADPKDPVFVLPVKIPRLDIDEEIKVDLSTGEWEKLAKACRYMLSLLFILFMIKLSIKLFGGRGDD